jgi:hypothetical protein
MSICGDQFVTNMGRRLAYQDSHPAAMGGGGIERRLCSHLSGRPPTLLMLRVWLFTEEAKGSFSRAGTRHHVMHITQSSSRKAGQQSK